MPINFPISLSEVKADSDYYKEIIKLHLRAENYLYGYKWCHEIIKCDLYFNLGDKIGVFLFDIVNGQSEEDNKVWVIVGDIPSMYLDTFGPRSIKEVLMDYIDLGKSWAQNIIEEKSLEECFPFKAEPSKELAKMFLSRIDSIENNLLHNIEDVKLRLM